MKAIPTRTAGLDSEVHEVAASGATLLSVHNTPDFMQLPLELQGFCPWTMVHAKGLLVPGKPALGVIRYENMYYVCEHTMAIRAFMEAPEEHLAQIKERAQRSPEYIHLLRMQTYFPSASIARLIERRIDPNYHWNEWELRRRVLKVVNLKNCSTVSQQTDNSHFKRDSETQVYLPRAKGTQTRKDQGTNPASKSSYITGLRGKIPEDAKAISQYIGADPATRNQARVVTITLDP
ncbi:CFAP206 [Symbiodinium microadriaticum]|nr:CFAP206 [Symbiodinium microadriaticum]